MTSQTTLVLANHRPETVPVAERLMAQHDAVILEEPPDLRFMGMLTGEVSIDAYLENQDLDRPLDDEIHEPQMRMALMGCIEWV